MYKEICTIKCLHKKKCLKKKECLKSSYGHQTSNMCITKEFTYASPWALLQTYWTRNSRREAQPSVALQVILQDVQLLRNTDVYCCLFLLCEDFFNKESTVYTVVKFMSLKTNIVLNSLLIFCHLENFLGSESLGKWLYCA